MSTDIAPAGVPLEIRFTQAHAGIRPVTRGIVLHSTRGPSRQRAGETLEAWLDREYHAAVGYMLNASNEVSPHFCVGPSLCARMVHDDNVAWHAREHNQTHLGIEIAQPSNCPPFTDSEVDYTARICAAWCDKYKIPAVHVTDSDQAGIIGHEETDQGRRDGKSDPGVKWNWAAFIPKVQAYLGHREYTADTLALNGVKIGAGFADWLNARGETDPDYGEPRVMCEVNPTDDTMLFLTTPRVLWWNAWENKIREIR